MTDQPQLRLTNTLTRQKEVFKPLDPNNVGLYVCGITPYDDAHIGHARVYVVFDVLFRLLRHLYGEDHVKYVRNFTDIDDKIIARAAEKGEQPATLAQKYIDSFHADMDALNVLRPTVEPRVSDPEVLRGIAQMIDALIEKQYAYVAPSGDVIYRTQKFPRFGQLAHRKLDEQRHGSRVKVDSEKENPNDFILWKANAKSATKLEQAFTPADYGAKNFNAPGRPGWHIECSVMGKQNLGPTFDIHGGGEDLQFPHHCCEIAQSEALLPPQINMANYWVHNGFITVNGTKMSKSLGNFTTIKDALQKYSPEAIRLWLLQTHYRKPVDYSDQALQASENRIERMLKDHIKDGYWGDVIELTEEKRRIFEDSISSLKNEFIEALLDDLNTALALSVISKLIKIGNDIPENIRGAIAEDFEEAFIWMMDILGIPSNYTDYNQRMDRVVVANAYMEMLLAERTAARTAKNWPESDRLRDELKKQGIELEDHPDGTTTWRRT